jgi:1,4-dihydroxy-2-naphthoate octaprenyltransferase
MKDVKNTPIQLLVEEAHLWLLLAGILTYSLGGGIANYLGHTIDWSIYWLGQALVTLLQLSGYYLKAYYDVLEDPANLRQRSQYTRRDGSTLNPKQVLLPAGLTVLSVGAVITVLMFSRGTLNLASLLILGVAFTVAFFYAVPPIRLVYSGYGELAETILITNLFPAMAYLFQTGEMHRLLLMLTLPVTALYLAMKVAYSLPGYSEDLRLARSTMVTRMGWQRGMNAHNLLILISFLLLGIAATLGLPWILTWPALLPLPIGLFQVWRMVQISNGAAPRWRLFLFLSAGIVGMMAYLIALALWTG